MRLSVVIVSWNVRDLLARCLASLYADLARAGLEARAVVVDNASHDGSADMVRAEYPQVELIARDDNPGFAAGNNCGLRALGYPGAAGKAEFALLLNPDTEVEPRALETLLAAASARPRAAVVTSRLTYGDGSLQDSAFRFPGLWQLYIDLFPVHGRLHASRLNGRYPRRAYEAGEPFAIDHPLGAVMLVRGAAMAQVGLFDEGYALYCEEIDWCARFKEAGWENYCAPAAHVVHYAGQSTGQVRVASFVKLWRSRYRLHTRHPSFAPMPLARRIVVAGIRRRMRDAPDDLRAACEEIIDVWTGRSA